MDDSFRLQWYPGHMAAARRRLEERLRGVDFVVEVADARAPAATRNPDLDNLIHGRPRLLVLAKADLADAGATRAWEERLSREGVDVVALSLREGGAARRLRERLQPLARRARRAGGALRLPRIPGVAMPSFGEGEARGMVVGIPNTGKSSLIRLLGGRGAAVGDRPGVTRGLVEFGAGKGLYLIDTPGLLWPRPALGHAALCLAWLGYAGPGAYDATTAARHLVTWLARNHGGLLSARYGPLEEAAEDPGEILAEIAARRGRLSGAKGTADAGATILLREFRAGDLGRLSLERPDDGGSSLP